MATTTLGDTTRVPSRSSTTMYWVIGAAIIVALLIAFFSMANRSGDMGTPAVTPGTESTTTPGTDTGTGMGTGTGTGTGTGSGTNTGGR